MASVRTAPLSRAEIFSAALRIVDEQGADALTMRRLARELGVEAMSLYHHIPHKQALLEGVIDLSLSAQTPQLDPAGLAWQTVVVAAASGFRRALVGHPNVLPLMIAHPPTSPQASATYIQALLRFLVARGFTRSQASQLFQAVFALAFGHALLSASCPAIRAEGLATVEPTEESFERSVRVLVDGFAAIAGVG